MSGLLALLDDVAAIAKVAAASIDDIAAAAAKAGAKAAGVVIDDAAVTPKYVHGFEAKRELPIIWRISLGSLKNKMIILLPAALLLSSFAPDLITPLLMIGGAYLCFEGAEKVFHKLFPHADAKVGADFDTKNPAHLEEEKIAGAIKTDFILSAEIIVISLGIVEKASFSTRMMVLVGVSILMTVGVYGLVAAIVKLDDLGMHLTAKKSLAARRIGRFILVAAPNLMKFLSVAGTVAMFLVGGGLLAHNVRFLHKFVERLSHFAAQAPLLGSVAETLTGMLLETCIGVASGAVVVAVLALIKLAMK